MNQIVRFGTAMLLCCTVVLAGCSRKKDEQALKARQPVFVMVPKGVHPYYEPCWKGFQDAAKQYGVTVDYRAAKQFEVPQQVEIIENLIAKHVDGLAISALDDQGLVSVIQQATDAGITVITFDAPAPSSKALCYIGTMNDAAGYAGGIEMAKLLDGKGDVAVLQGGLAAPNLNDRYKGFERALKEKAPGITIVAREDTQGKNEVVMNKAEAILLRNPNLRAFFSVSAEGIPGVQSVLRTQKKEGRILLGGFDDLPETLTAIRDGVAQFCIAQKTYKMGWLSIEKLLEARSGRQLEKQIDTGFLIISRANVDTYMQDMTREFQQPAQTVPGNPPAK